MAKDRMREAAQRQVDEAARDVPAEHREGEPAKQERTERIVIRVSVDEYKRISRYFVDRNLPLSTGARAALLDLVRKG